MPSPFNSSYVNTSVTAATPMEVAAQKEVPRTSGTAPVPEVKAGQAGYGFDPTRYGLGKPRRIIIRGKIAIE
jgi:hypothetical protein